MHGSVVVTDWHATKSRCACTNQSPRVFLHSTPSTGGECTPQKCEVFTSVKSGLRLPVGTLTTQLRIGASHVPQLQ